MYNENDIDKIKLTNFVIYKEKKIWIKINKPNDFIYDLDDLFIIYDPEFNYKEVIGNIPKYILANMNQHNNYDLISFINILEDNLTLFCSGKQLNMKDISKTTINNINNNDIGFIEMNDYKFIFRTISNPNIKIDIFKENISIFGCEKLSIYVKCNNCNVVIHYITNNREMKCTNCNKNIIINYIASFDSNYLGYLMIKNCSIVLIGTNNYHFTCETCQTIYKVLNVDINHKYSYTCFNCHKLLKFVIENIYLITSQKIHIKEGTELPDKGTCQHYSKSYRWFCFPCCNLLYPCDICHNNKSNHLAEYANIMICGFCSKRQSVKKICSCTKNQKQYTQFWEGGKGNRNKITLSKKDSKKYK